ncbi:BspA family leucine-rich repeat surface protein [Xylocopilactobacillus apicola]|uniref:Mub B2-like domain-containing protein n=1 Tax=Xylocopilactobacillus apicola TaxID=2932184 RepID=A0AAU9DZB3_9LACO|nr:BspA family leucine-rich repeat surface protein [Xylocopilactobacillus apicola]BDR59613.1 hypothetical protein XA3_20540 [Xylocopilactobacillus apicola]
MNKRLILSVSVAGLMCPLALMNREVKADTVPDKVVGESQENLAPKVDTKGISIGNFSTVLLKSGTWGTTKWDYFQNGNDYILRFHAGTLPKDPIVSMAAYPISVSSITKIQFDPGVVAPEDSSNLFCNLNWLTEIDGLENLDTSNTTNMSKMFMGCASLFSFDFSEMNTSNVTDMSRMFEGCNSLYDLNLDSFDTSKVTNMESMFKDSLLLTDLSLKNFNTSQVTNFSKMFYNCPNLSSLDLSSFSVPQADDLSDMFSGCTNLSNINLSGFGETKSADLSNMFFGCSSLASLDLSKFSAPKATNMSNMFGNCSNLSDIDLSNFHTDRAGHMENMFNGCANLASLDLSSFNTRRVTSMDSMFKDCSKLKQIDLSSFNTLYVKSMSRMFSGCKSISQLNLQKFNTMNVLEMNQMFFDCTSLTSLDLSNFKTPKLKQTWEMFKNCSSLRSLDLSNLYTKVITQYGMDNMFDNTPDLNHLVLGPGFSFNNKNLLKEVPAKGTKIPGTNRIVNTSTWVATKGYQQGWKYTSYDLCINVWGVRDQITTYDWDSDTDISVEVREVTRTINLHQVDNIVNSIKQTAKIQRTVTINADGSKTYSEWSKAQWDQYDVPKVLGCAATQDSVQTQTVDGSTADSTIDIYYDYVQTTVEIQYSADGRTVGTQKYMGYLGDVINVRYRVPRGYEIIGTPPTTITVDGSENQVITINVKLQKN